ncbi:hypothetical protein B7R25_08995 [Subtercola boreus]|uniref:Xaa-Pro dipeptidyl-peptidase C-terminal domain-containing protein n=1 Tax=Subtercola boreus TaxID=120213 RepID=A0A3E0WAA2_9MICO|nr:hypothetical protein B7R24_08930 [Subtercola boreus]RFA20661.1 hypothetical protein B7R23_08865 [Subtercola boreus]RFA26871.1 hypothetical protein B7R25_08995 [Subtercola boreus]
MQTRKDVAAVYTADQWPPKQASPLVLHLDASGNALSATSRPGPAQQDAPHGKAQFRWRFEHQADVDGPMRLRVAVSMDRDDLTLFAGVRKFSRGEEVVFEGSYGFTEDIVTRGWLRAAQRAVDPTKETEW